MADVTTRLDIRAILKTVYKDGIESVLYRNSPLLKQIPSTRIEGKEYRFALIYGRGGAVSGFANQAATYALAQSSAKNAEFALTPGYLFSDYTTDFMEKTASKSAKGAYMKAEANQFFASLEAFRKTLAKVLYGSGYGELGRVIAVPTSVSSGYTMPLDESTIIGMDIGTQFQFGTKNATYPSQPGQASLVTANTYVVTAVDDATNTITFAVSGGAYAAPSAGDWIFLTGSRDAAGGPELPVGLNGWLPAPLTSGTSTPTTEARTAPGAFYGNELRGSAPSRFMGQYKDYGLLVTPTVAAASGGFTLSSAISDLFRLTRRYGAEPDVIVLNDKDRLYLQGELNSQQTYWQSVTEQRDPKTIGANIGFSEIAFAFSTSWLNKLIDDPYLESGRFYILTLKNGSRPNIEMVLFTDANKLQTDGIRDNEPGRADPNKDQEEYSDNPYSLNVDDLVTVSDGGKGNHGSVALVELKLAGTFAVYAPANCGVGAFALPS